MNPRVGLGRALRLVTCVLTLLSLLHGSVSWSQQAATDVEEQTKLLVVMIRGKLAGADTFGAGLIFGAGADRLYIATANHVVRQGAREVQDLQVQFRWLPGESVEAKLLIDVDRALDLAVLSVSDLRAISTPTLPFDRLGNAGVLRRRDAVYSIGFPAGRPWHSRVTPDAISEASVDLLKFESTFLAPGHSGGALVDERWELVGMIRSDQSPDGEAVRVDRILDRLRRWNYPVSLRPATAAPGAEVEIRYFEARTTPRGTALCWSVGNARSARIEPDLGELDPKTLEKECREVRPSGTTAYTLTATGQDGRTVSRQTTVAPHTSEADTPAVPEKTGRGILGGWSRYRNTTYGFTFEYPAIYDEGPSRCGVREHARGLSLGYRSELSFHESHDSSLEDFVDKLIGDGSITVTARRTRKVGRLDAIEVEYRFGGVNRFGTFTAAYAGSLIYVFQFTAGAVCDRAGIHEINAYGHMIDTFKIGR